MAPDNERGCMSSEGRATAKWYHWHNTQKRGRTVHFVVVSLNNCGIGMRGDVPISGFPKPSESSEGYAHCVKLGQ